MNNTKLVKLGLGTALLAASFIAQTALADVTKQGTELIATDPQVTVTKKEEDSIWSDVDVNIKTEIPDEVTINSGDKMTFNIPEELNLETSYNFPVYNETGETEVGTADVKANERTVTTTFNNYFAEHPLDKSISLNFMTKINREIVQENTKRNISFNGTVVEINAGSKGTINPNEELYKYGYQDRADQNVVHWVARLNYKRQEMVNVDISDTWSSDQDYIEGSLIYSYVNDVDPWTYDSPATQALQNTKFHKNGFTTHIDKIENKILMVEYKTRLRSLEYNPTNLFTASWNGGFVSHEAETKLFDGNGKATGKSRPKWEIPNEAPMLDKPEIDLNDVPLLPPAPILEKPELNIEDIPVLPPAPVLEKPALKIPEEPEKPSTPPSVEKESAKVVEPVSQKPARELPKTGEDRTVFLSVIGAVAIIGLGFWMQDRGGRK